MLFVIGFLRTKTTFDKTDPLEANLGIKDIGAGVRWVKKNIGSFGGDPNRITLIGHDTGAALVNLLFLSPDAKGSSCLILTVQLLFPRKHC